MSLVVALKYLQNLLLSIFILEIATSGFYNLKLCLCYSTTQIEMSINGL